MAHKRLHAIVHGRVQGVNFRWHTRERAQQLSLVGWVRNLRSGRRVELVAEGPANDLGDFVRFLHQGPPAARVDNVEVAWDKASGEFSDFSVRYI